MVKGSATATMSDWIYARTQIDTSMQYKPVSEAHTLLSVESGHLVIYSPSQSGSYAELVVPHDSRISIIVNGKTVSGTALISARDVIALKTYSVEPEIWLTHEISPEKHEVKITVNTKVGTRIRLMDSSQTKRLVLRLEEEKVLPDPLSLETIYQYVRGLNVYGELDDAAIERLSYSRCNLSETVVHGLTELQDKPRKITLSVACEIDRINHIVRPPFINAGVEFGTISLTSDEPKNEQTKESETETKSQTSNHYPFIGDGVENRDGKLISTKTGRLFINKKRIDIVPELTINHDIDASDGVISFDGNVTVNGSISDRATVRASGLVMVIGSVNRATVIGETGVVIRGSVIQGNITAGRSHVEYQKIMKMIAEILVEMTAFQSDYQTLFEAVMQRKDSERVLTMIPKALFEKKYARLKSLLETMIEIRSDSLYPFDDVLKAILLYIKLKWTGTRILAVNHGDIEELLRRLREYQERSDSLDSSDFASIHVLNVSRTRLYATGSIMVTGSGTYISSLESGRDVSIAGGARGGFILANRKVWIGELGSDIGVETSVRVRELNGTVEIGLRHPNTVIDIGGRRNRNITIERKIKYWRGMCGDEIADNR